MSWGLFYCRKGEPRNLPYSEDSAHCSLGYGTGSLFTFAIALDGSLVIICRAISTPNEAVTIVTPAEQLYLHVEVTRNLHASKLQP